MSSRQNPRNADAVPGERDGEILREDDALQVGPHSVASDRSQRNTQDHGPADSSRFDTFGWQQQILRHTDLADSVLVLAWRLSAMADLGGYCNLSQGSLADRSGRSLSTIKRAMRALQEHGYVTHVYRSSSMYEASRVRLTVQKPGGGRYV